MKNFLKFTIGLSLLVGAFIYIMTSINANLSSPNLVPFIILNGLGLVLVGWCFLSSSTTEEMVRSGIVGICFFIGQKVFAAYFPQYLTWIDEQFLTGLLKAIFK